MWGSCMRLFFSRSSFVRLSIVAPAPEGLSEQSSTARTELAGEPASDLYGRRSRGPDSGPLASVTVVLAPDPVTQCTASRPRRRRVVHAPPSVRCAARRRSVRALRMARRLRPALLPAFRRPLPVREAPGAAEVEIPLAAQVTTPRIDPEADDEPQL